MKKELKIGEDYITCFYPEPGNKKMIYQGNDTWLIIEGEKQQIVTHKVQTEKVLEYINKPTIIMGNIC